MQYTILFPVRAPAQADLTPQDLLREIDALAGTLATAAEQLNELRQRIERPLTERAGESRRRHALLADYCRKVQRHGDLYNAKSKSGYNVSKLGKLAGLANADVREWLSGQRKAGGATDLRFRELFRRHGLH
jgi:hypothetical protein